MRKYNFCLGLIWLLIATGCYQKPLKKGDSIRENYANVLEIGGFPQKSTDLKPFGFSDRGAWMGYTLPSNDSDEGKGGFVGPLLMKMYGQWLSRGMAQLSLFDNTSKQVVPLREALVENKYLPGELRQKLEVDGLSCSLKLGFASNRTALVEVQITNTGEEKRLLTPGFSGEWLAKPDTTFEEKQVLSMALDGGLYYQRVSQPVNIQIQERQYIQQFKEPVSIKPGASVSFALSQTWCFSDKELQQEKRGLMAWLKEPALVFEENSQRWNTYLESTFANMKKGYEDEVYKRLAVKCVQTLMSNWRSPAGALKHDGVFPSAAYQGFYGFWSWDSWKHAVALGRFNPELARSSILSMFDFQNEEGMVADCVYFNETENNWRDTKPPLATWAVREVFRITGDTAFVRQIFPRLTKYHKWWYQYRDFNKNGLCEYGSTDGTLIAAKWESGMDNAVRFDQATMEKGDSGAWSFNQESVDLNTYLALEKEDLSFLAALIGKKGESEMWAKEAEGLKKQIRTDFFDNDYFYDVHTANRQTIRVQGPEGWIPLWAKVASVDQAKAVKTIMCDSSKFFTQSPFPTLTADHPMFNPLMGYWRGPVWLDQAYFGIKGLENYGFHKEADLMTQALFENSEGVMDGGAIRENYHPLTGKGLNARHFSWSAAHLLLLLMK